MGLKHAQFRAILYYFRLWLRISLERGKKSKIGKTCICDSFCVRWKSPVKFGPQTNKFYWLTLSHPSGFFGGDYISALRGAALTFLYALEIDQAFIAHTQMGWGSAKNFWSWKFKVWPKIQRISPYNFGASGSILTTRRRGELFNFGPQTKKL